MSDINRTLDAVEIQGWQVVLLAPKSKRPTGATWQITRHLGEIAQHVSKGGNIGLVCGPESGVMVLDFDAPGALAEMSAALEPIKIWVETGSGKFHCYFKWEDNVPARMIWRGEKIGEVQRGPALQHVVMPPSVHPVYNKNYVWVCDPLSPLPALPDAWRKHLMSEVIPSFIPTNREGQPEEEPWMGPPPEELLRRAMEQPGARRRRNGVKMQCPGCRKEGHDRSKDNALVGLDGRWGCALDSRHSRDIGEALGVMSVEREVLGDDADELRHVSIDDLD